ncbi:24372_t:CDS:2, partial [Gigaspora margarita]
ITLIADSYDVRGALIYTNMELNNIVIYFFDTLINHTEFINAVEPFNPEIIYASTQSFLQNMIRPRRRDVNSRDLVVKVSGGDGVYNEAVGVHGIVVTVGPGISAVQSLDTILYFVHDKLGIFRDVMVYVEGS